MLLRRRRAGGVGVGKSFLSQCQPSSSLLAYFRRNLSQKNKSWKSISTQRHFLANLAKDLGVVEVNFMLPFGDLLLSLPVLFETFQIILFLILISIWFSTMTAFRVVQCVQKGGRTKRRKRIVSILFISRGGSSTLFSWTQLGRLQIRSSKAKMDSLFSDQQPGETTRTCFSPQHQIQHSWGLNHCFLCYVDCVDSSFLFCVASRQIGMTLQSKRLRKQWKVVHWQNFILPFLMHCRLSFLTLIGILLASTLPTCLSHPLPHVRFEQGCSKELLRNWPSNT